MSFRILGPDGEPITAYTQTHDKDLHFIAVRRGLSGLQHVHPSKGANGQWSTAVAVNPGTWRFFADFAQVKLGQPITVGVDAAVPGAFIPSPVPPPSRTAMVGDYTVTLDGVVRTAEFTQRTTRTPMANDATTPVPSVEQSPTSSPSSTGHGEHGH